MTVRVRLARPDDCDGLAAFRRRMEGGTILADLRGPAFYRHKYFEIGVASVAEAHGVIVGMTAGSPRRLTLRGQTLMAADLGDLFIDPSYRGQGLFRRLHDSTLAALRERGVQVVTVQPGPPAVPALSRAFGYVPLFPIAEWTGIVDRRLAIRAAQSRWRRLLLRVLPALLGAPGSPGEVVVGAATGLDGPPVSPDGWPQATTLRDAEWLEARYSGGPTPYEAVVARGGGAATVVFLVQKPLPDHPARGWLVDGWANGPAAQALAHAAVRRVVSEMRARGVSIAQLWSARGATGPDPFVRAARRCGFLRQPLTKRLFGWAEPGAGIAFPAGAEWLFRMGDTDGI